MREAFSDPSIEAVSIATPNHWHALAAIWAMKAARTSTARSQPVTTSTKTENGAGRSRDKRMLQIGSQHRSTPFKMRAMEAVQGGLIGKIYLAKGLCFKRRASIGHKPDSPTPPGVNWICSSAPRPMRPFNELRFKYNWHWFWTRATATSAIRASRDRHVPVGLGRSRVAQAAFAQAASTRTRTIRKRRIRCFPASTTAGARYNSKSAAC